jgi:hypothetical protein
MFKRGRIKKYIETSNNEEPKHFFFYFARTIFTPNLEPKDAKISQKQKKKSKIFFERSLLWSDR